MIDKYKRLQAWKKFGDIKAVKTTHVFASELSVVT